MTDGRETAQNPVPVDASRRRLIGAAGAGALAMTFSGLLSGSGGGSAGSAARTLRWGVVGTGGIANSMAPMIKQADHAELAAVSSRRMETAREYADAHDVPNAFDAWADMVASDSVDAIYVATPTAVKEEICIAAARNGKHVLGEKPLADLASLRRITTACREHGVGFMDATHFVHSPRTAEIKAHLPERVGWPWSVASAFQFSLTDPNNIRMNPDLEPYGAIGDAGWYTMRTAVEFLAPGVRLVSANAYMRRGGPKRAAVSGSGVLVFDDASTLTWNCGFQSGAGIMDLRISGENGVVKLDDFLTRRPTDRTADYEYRQHWNDSRYIEVPQDKHEAALMYQDFAEMVQSEAWKDASMLASERTQEFLDAAWRSALDNEMGA